MMEYCWLVTAILGAIVLCCILYFTIAKNNFWEIRGVVSEFSLPLVGSMFSVLASRKGAGEFMNDLYCKFQGERISGYFQLTTPSLLVREPALLQKMFIKDVIHFEDRTPNMSNPNNPSDLFTSGLGHLTGDEWRTARHKLTQTFTSKKLKAMFGSISGCGDNLFLHITNNVDEAFNARELSLTFIINVIADVAFGLKIDTMQGDRDSDFLKVCLKFFQPSAIFMIKMMIVMNSPKIGIFFNMKLTDSTVENFFRKLTTDVIKYRESTGTRRNDFLQVMLDQRAMERKATNTKNQKNKVDDFVEPEDEELFEQLKNTPAGSGNGKKESEIFTDDFISSQTFSFISGGSETTAAVLMFVLYELAVNKDLQIRVQEEIAHVLSQSEFNYDAVKKMTYMEQFINESLRLHPVATAIMRVCTKDYKIPDSEVILKKGEFAVCPVIGLHKDPQYFPDPEKFDPDRFEHADTIPKGVYYNFGIGPRICIAKRLALLQMKIFLAKILLNFNISLSNKTKLPIKLIKSSFILNVEGGLWVKFEKRKPSTTKYTD